ncbi:MAG TPA: glycosyl hydrolase 108 family protein [Geminicoccaceae bacterium]|nr:glycosyl hydrolase 108 family protein [Geminicoccaceae bacterium]
MTDVSSAVDRMIEDAIRREGGFVDRPADRGGPSKFGITQATLAGSLGRAATSRDVEALSPDQARQIYRRDHYHGPRIDRLPARIQPLIFDSAVNHGPGRAIAFVQQVCNLAGFGPLVVDGLCDPKTIRAAHDAAWAMKDWLLAALVEERRNFYRAIVARDPGQAVLLERWLAHLREFDPPMERSAA